MKQVAMLFVACALIFFAEYSSAKYLLVDIDDRYNGKIYISCQLKSKHAENIPCHSIHCQVLISIPFLDTTAVPDVCDRFNDNTFQCTDSSPSNPKCISTNKVCDGKIDCMDGSDESLHICAPFPHGEQRVLIHLSCEYTKNIISRS